MNRRPPHPEPLRGSALSHEGRGERKLVSKRQVELLTRVKKKRATQSPSPLVGEGGGAQSAAPGEGALPPVLFARKLRETMTDAERKLWHALHGSSLCRISNSGGRCRWADMWPIS